MDFFGNKISVGDTVAFIAQGHRELINGTVIKLTTKTVLIEYNSYPDFVKQITQRHDQVIVNKN